MQVSCKFCGIDHEPGHEGCSGYPNPVGAGPDPTTRRAEEIREATGIAWEIACQRAEAERDAADEAERQSNEDTAQEHGYDECPDCGDVGVKITAAGYVPCTRFLSCWTDR